MTDRLHLDSKHRRMLEAPLRQHLPDTEVWAYGSRVSGKCYNGSDLDLMLRGSGLTEIPIDRIGDFNEAMQESIIPFFVFLLGHATGPACRSGSTVKSSALTRYWRLLVRLRESPCGAVLSRKRTGVCGNGN